MPSHAVAGTQIARSVTTIPRLRQVDAQVRPAAPGRADGGCVTLHLSGSGAIAIGGVDRVLAAGDLVLVPVGAAAATFRCGYDARHLVLDIDPAGVLGRSLRGGAPILLDGGSGLGRIASDLMRSAHAAHDTLDPRQRASLHASLEALLAGALRHREVAPPAPRLVEQHCAIVKHFLERHLADAAITAGSVAATHRISVRHLHRMFRATGTSFGGWLRERRLERCREDLASAGMTRTGVATIAFRWGFNDAAHFSRLFKRTYGIAPREYRIAAGLRTPAPQHG